MNDSRCKGPQNQWSCHQKVMSHCHLIWTLLNIVVATHQHYNTTVVRICLSVMLLWDITSALSLTSNSLVCPYCFATITFLPLLENTPLWCMFLRPFHPVWTVVCRSECAWSMDPHTSQCTCESPKHGDSLHMIWLRSRSTSLSSNWSVEEASQLGLVAFTCKPIHLLEENRALHVMLKPSQRELSV